MKWIRNMFKKEDLSHKMTISARDMGKGRYEVEGVVLTASSIEQAICKYSRACKKADKKFGDKNE